MLCPVGNANCMCQYCEDKCNNGFNCYECQRQKKPVHDIYLCTGFKGDLEKYINEAVANGKNRFDTIDAKANEEEK